jgi:predicted PurR-regulated permease PerM
MIDAPATVPRHDLTRTMLVIICILVMIGGSLWILRPFLAATVWATMIVVATWPALMWLERALGNRRGRAVTVMTLGMLLLLVVPLWTALGVISEHADDVRGLATRLADSGLPPPPEWVGKVPVVGKRLSATMADWAAAGPAALEARLRPYAAVVGQWIIDRAGGIGSTLLQFLLVVLVSAILYSSGEAAAGSVRRFGRRLAGERGEGSVILAGQAIRSVALGVGVTAIVQTVLGAIGLLIAGVPFVSVLSAVMALLCIAQLGPALILFPAVAWMYWTGDNGWATFLLVWSIVVAALDNVLRPILIRRGADLPLLLIIAGVIGGLIGFGLIGIFIGPVVLAVTYTLLSAWMADDMEEEARHIAPVAAKTA